MSIIKKKGFKAGKQKYIVRVRYKDIFGNQKTIDRTVYGKEEAKIKEMELKTQLNNLQKPDNFTIQKLYDEYIEEYKHGVRETTIYSLKKHMRNYILPILGKVKLKDLDLQILNKWKNEINNKELSLASKQNVYATLRKFLNYAVKLEYIPQNPLNKLGNFQQTLQIKKEMQFYTREEFLKYIEKAKLDAVNAEKNGNLSVWDYYVFFSIAFYTGMRKGEIHALKWTDIEGNIIHIKRSIAQKLKGEDRETAPKNSSSVRDIMIPDPLMEILKDHHERWKKYNEFTEDFRICGGVKCLRDTTLSNYNKKYAAQAGVKQIRIHDFRHSHASLLVNSNINIHEVARRLGHSDIEMTMNTYSHLYPKEEEKALSVLNDVK